MSSHRLLYVLLSIVLVLGCGRERDDPRQPEPDPGTRAEAETDVVESRLQMARALLEEGQVASALEQLRRLGEDPSQRVGAGRVPAWTDDIVERLIRRGAVDAADSLLRRIGPLEERSVRQQILTANMQVLAGEVDQAVATYRSIDPDDPESQVQVLHELATLHLRRGDPGAALDRGREALSLAPERGPLRILVARALVELDRPDAALEELRAMPPSVARWATEGEIQLDVYDRPDSAVTLLTRAAREVPNDSAVALLLGRSLLAAGEPGPAASILRPLAARPRPYAGSRSVLAEAFDRLGRVAAADSLRAIVQERDRAVQRERLRAEGLRLSMAGDLVAALETFDRALAIAPGDGELYHDRGVVLARMQEWEQARKALETAARLRPDDPSVLVNLARLHDRTGNAAASDSVLARAEALRRE